LTELQIEWGLTDEEFNLISAAKIQRIIEFRNIKAIGENARNKNK